MTVKDNNETIIAELLIDDPNETTKDCIDDLLEDNNWNTFPLLPYTLEAKKKV